MKVKEILKEKIDCHYGFQLESIAISTLTEKEIMSLGYQRLKTIPHKITAFLRRPLIVRAWKSNCFGVFNYYLVQTNDDTIFYLQY